MGESVTSIIIAVIGTGILTTLVNKFAYGKNEYADRLERRVANLERKMEAYELRDNVQSSAINCAHKCDKPDDECPVLGYLASHPIASKEGED